MSISDLIIVMKEGVLQQIGKPQEVYDDPVNLFVAKFLGTPPINCFDARVAGEKLYIGSEAVMDAPGVAEGSYVAAIRPEGFEPCAEGPLTCSLQRVEIMGRDVSMVCRHEAFTGDDIRAIVEFDEILNPEADTVRFRLKKNKVFLFEGDTGSRIRF